MAGPSSRINYRDRGPAFWVGAVAAASIVILYVGNIFDSLGLDDLAAFWNDDLLGLEIAGITLDGVLTVIFWISFLALLVLLFADRKQPGASEVEIDSPAFARYLFLNTRAGLFWLPIRLFLGFAWLASGLGKLGEPAWQDGTALLGFWNRIVDIPEQGRPAITYDWYRGFIQALIDGGHESWFQWVVVLGEIAVGLGLLFGLLTGIAAFFGALMNISFMLAGSAGVNPVLFTLAIGVMLGWRVAGWYGIDRYLLRRLGAAPMATSAPLAGGTGSGGASPQASGSS